MARLFKFLGAGMVSLLALGGSFYAWASHTTSNKLEKVYETHRIELVSPLPLSDTEIATVRAEKLTTMTAAGTPAALEDGTVVDPLAGVDLDGLARDRAIARGQHIVESRFACIECHGKDFGGGVMVDDPMVGHLLGPNLTTGKGSVTLDFTMADWDRIVRHGVKPDGTPAVMPSGDFVGMSDQELSDIVAYIRSLPPVDATVDPPSLGPLMVVLTATGEVDLGADLILAHPIEHPALPPNAEPTAAFGAHLAQVCTGCHRQELNGGPIAAGPPDWAPARNLTPSEDGLKGWTYDQFQAAIRTGTRPDGSKLKMPMTLMAPYGQKMSEVEMQALFAYVQSVPPMPTGN